MNVGLRLIVATVATKESPSFKRFLNSVRFNGMSVKVLGSKVNFVGFGCKPLALRNELEHYKNDQRTVFLFVDANDVLINAGTDQILERFQKSGARILFSAEIYCFPCDESLESIYPRVKEGKRFINAGAVIGFAPDLYRLLTAIPLKAEDDDQLYYHKIYLNEKLRNELGLKIDHRSELFATANGDPDDFQMIFKGRNSYLYNQVDKTWPVILHEPGRLKLMLDTYANYIPNVWNEQDGCTTCLEDNKDLSLLREEDYPSVVMAIFAIDGTSRLEQFFSYLQQLQYPKNKIRLFVHNSVTHRPRRKLVDVFVTKAKQEYRSVNYIESEDFNQTNIPSPKDIAVEECVKWKCDYYLNVDSSAQLDNPRTLRLLIEQNRQVVAPILFTPDRSQVNFGGIVARYEFCPSSLDIIKNNRSGLWRVDHVSSCYLVNGGVILNSTTKPIYSHQEKREADAFFSEVMGIHDIPLWASNRFHFGHLRL